MKSIPDPDTTPDEKMAAFETGLRRVLDCSKTQLDHVLKYEKKVNSTKPNKRGPKPSSASGRESRAKR